MSAEWGSSRGAGLASRSRGVLALVPERCTSCLACARECPTWCIDIEAHTEAAPPVTPRGRARTHTVLDRFAVDFGLCMYCGVCIEVCPFDALHWADRYADAAAEPGGLRHDREQLAAEGSSAPSSDS